MFEDNDPANTNRTRSTRAIALNATGNTQGGYFFMSLKPEEKYQDNNGPTYQCPTES
jgi:hypothetical protein